MSTEKKIQPIYTDKDAMGAVKPQGYDVGTVQDNIKFGKSEGLSGYMADTAKKQAQANDVTQKSMSYYAEQARNDARPTFNKSMDDYATDENVAELEKKQPNEAMSAEERADYEKKARRRQTWQAITDGLANIASLGGTMAGGLPTRHINFDDTKKHYDAELAKDKEKNDAYWQRWREARKADREAQMDRYADAYNKYKQDLDDWNWRNVLEPAQRAKERREERLLQIKEDEAKKDNELRDAKIDYMVAKGEITKEQAERIKKGLPPNPPKPSSGRSGSGKGKYYATFNSKDYPTKGSYEQAVYEYALANGIATNEDYQGSDAFGQTTTKNRNINTPRVAAAGQQHAKQQGGNKPLQGRTFK